MNKAAEISGKIKTARGQALLFFVVPALLLCFAPTPFSFNSAAQAQNRVAPQQTGRYPEPPKRRSFWDKLFGRNKQQDYGQQRQNRAAPPMRRAAPAAPAKNADARRVLVIGDFTAAALAEALNRAYSDNPNILILSKTENHSGLADGNWTGKLKNLALREKPNLIIVMLGANDTLAENAKMPAQNTAYQAQIEALTKTLQKTAAAWLWVGLPPFKDTALNDNAAALNRLYARAAEQAGGHFVSTAEGFVDDKGNFALSGYDVSGRQARLRANDGINFTPAGRRKLAFYASQAIELLWGDAADQSLSDSGAGSRQNARLAPVNPLDIGISAKPVLAGSRFTPAAQTAKQAENEKQQDIKGRADDFRFAPPAPQAAP